MYLPHPGSRVGWDAGCEGLQLFLSAQDGGGTDGDTRQLQGRSLVCLGIVVGIT